MKKYKDLTELEKKARLSDGRMDCGKCPNHKPGFICGFSETCSHIFMTAYIRGYKQKEKEIKQKS